ncbi:MAG: ABC transporter ATP-binding protein [Anaerolineae bacterium]|nr:ABC transporter ATP-binding protein [Anaerolineae bacterium]
MSELSVEMIAITKTFLGVVANNSIDLAVRLGEIHALLGENGAGKSTLMKILAGAYQPDSGHILINGSNVHLNSPADALKQGIGMVYQHFMLVETMTVEENLLLGLDTVDLIPNRKKLRTEFETLSRQYGLDVPLNARVWQLSVGEKQRVEILRLLHRGADILILDEPTAVLTPQEAEQLGHSLRQMMALGKSVVLITHKLDEVMQFADRVTVLRSGDNVVTVDTANTSPTQLARHMLGHEMARVQRTSEPSGDEVILRAEGISAMGDRGLRALNDVSFEVHEGEILGIAGVAGNGQRELAEVLAGLRPLQSGRVWIRDKDITRNRLDRTVDQYLGYVPEDRLHMGSVPGLAVSDNLILKSYHQKPFSRSSLLNFSAIKKFVSRMVKQFNVVTSSVDTPIEKLSGGNIQKVILAREISIAPEAIIVSQPTRGLDVGAAESVHRLLLEQRKQGKAILLISEDLDELLLLSDRITVLSGGVSMGTILAAEADIDELGLMMTGVNRTAHQQMQSEGQRT